jgi:uncharacterized protein (DUF1684 family)
MPDERTDDLLDLMDFKRQIADLYRRVQATADPAAAWRDWRETRDALFTRHAQSPIRPEERAGFDGLAYFDHDPGARVAGEVVPAPRETIAIGSSGETPVRFTRTARVRFTLAGAEHELDLFWLDGYGGGLYLPFADATSGTETYGAGRYLLDTVKGADLGADGDRLVLDFNFAYNPSCAYDPRWLCPLAPPANRLPVAVRAGERVPG